MPRCINRDVRHRPDPEVNALTAYMNRRAVASFDELRQNVPELVTLTDAQIMQVIQDAKLDHDDG